MTKNLLAWMLILLISFGSFALSYWGPETHSTEAEAPTASSRAISTLIVLLISGAIFLPIRSNNRVHKVNIPVVVGGWFCLAMSLVSLLFAIARKDFQQEGILWAWAVLGICVLMLFLIGRKIYLNLRMNV